MDFRACLAATLLAAAALMANAQPAGSRDPAALRSRADGSPPRRTYDFVIQKAEVRELSSSQLFLPPPAAARYSAQSPTYRVAPAPAPRPLGSPAAPEAERLQKKQPSAKGKPTSKPRGDGGDTRTLLLGLSTPLAAAQGGYTYDKPGTAPAPANRQVATWQLPPYFPISTYASYAVPTYYNQQQQQPQQHKGRISPDISSNSLGTEEQGEVPSLLGLDEARPQEGNRRPGGFERDNGRRGKSMKTDASGAGNGDSETPNCCKIVSVEDLSSVERSRLESSEEVKATSGESASVESGYHQNADYVLPRPGDKTQNSAIDAAVEAAKSAAEHNERAGSAQPQQGARGQNAAAVQAAKAAIGYEQGGGYVLPRPGDRQHDSVAINAAVEAAKAAAAGNEQGQGSPAMEAAAGAAKVAGAQVEAAKAAIAAEASRAAAGALPAAAVAAAPGARLVTQVALRRRGGVAIAGPGGTAAAGAGGVAVVGPGGVAFARPNALSVVGPGGRVVALPAGAPEPRAGEALPLGARVVAVGPTVYLHPADAAAPPPQLPTLSFYKSPGWALFAPPPPLPPLSALANLYTIINGRTAAPAPAPYLNAYHHNLLNLQPHYYSKPFASAKVSAESPVKIFQPAPIPLSFQTLPRAGAAEPYQFPTNRPPPAVTTTPHPPTTTTTITTREPEPTSSEEVTTPTAPPAPTTAPAESGTSPPPADGKTVLILKPFAKAVAGINGTAVATPVGHAVYHKGQPVDVVFDPRAVAVAGPGGHARAHSDLIVSYVEKEEPEHRAQLTELNYFGAARGRRPVLAWQLRQEGDVEGGGDSEQGGSGGGGGGSGGGGGGGGGGGAVDSVVVNQPPPGASVAEARPVGLSIAGAGGVAASKPQATAVVGPGGLAVARPVATAIAGVPPGALLGGGPGGPGGGAAQQYQLAAAAGDQVAVGPGPASAKYSVLPAGAAAARVRGPAPPVPGPHDALVYVPVYVV